MSQRQPCQWYARKIRANTRETARAIKRETASKDKQLLIGVARPLLGAASRVSKAPGSPCGESNPGPLVQFSFGSCTLDSLHTMIEYFIAQKH